MTLTVEILQGIRHPVVDEIQNPPIHPQESHLRPGHRPPLMLHGHQYLHLVPGAVHRLPGFHPHIEFHRRRIHPNGDEPEETPGPPEIRLEKVILGFRALGETGKRRVEHRHVLGLHLHLDHLRGALQFDHPLLENPFPLQSQKIAPLLDRRLHQNPGAFPGLVHIPIHDQIDLPGRPPRTPHPSAAACIQIELRSRPSLPGVNVFEEEGVFSGLIDG